MIKRRVSWWGCETQYHAVLHNTVQYSSVQHCDMLRSIMLLHNALHVI